MTSEPLLRVEALCHAYNRGRRDEVRAVQDISFRVAEGETFGIVGESGSGKTTLGRCIVGLYRSTSGEIRYRGKRLYQRRDVRVSDEIQMIFQDPYASLDPRMRVRDIVAEGIDIRRPAPRRDERADRVEEMLRTVGLDASHASRFPHELSGGQRQRVGIARALIVEPRLLVCDEPISALDVSIQAQIVNLLADLQRTRGLTYVFIAHDLAMVRHLSTRIGVMYRGRLVEVGPADAVWHTPLHPYTASLLSAVPLADPDAERSRVRTSYQPPDHGEAPQRMSEVAPGRFVFGTDDELAGYGAKFSG